MSFERKEDTDYTIFSCAVIAIISHIQVQKGIVVSRLHDRV